MTPAAVARLAAESLDARPPADLLRRFAASRDPEAFAGLVRQFGPVVLGTCRRVLGPGADADDAFQAVFVALARQAGRFRDAQALPAWLHRVALRTARKQLARRRPAAPPAAEPFDPADPFAEVVWKDVRRVLDEELDRLPEQLRGPVVLCWLDGLTRDEAAARLGVSLNTVKRRLDAGRELLRDRLLRRGVAPAAVAAATLDPAGLRAVVPHHLLAAATAAARTAAPAGGLRIMAAVVLAATVAAGAAVGVGSGTPAQNEKAAAAATPPGAAPPEPAPPPRVAAEPARLAGVTARYGTLHYRTPGPVLGSALSPDGQLLAVANPDGVRLYEVPGWRLARELAAPGGHHQVCLRPLAFSPDGTHLAYRREYGVVTVWDLPGGKPGRDVRAGADTKWRPLMAFVAGNLLALAEVERLVVFDPATGAEVRAVPAANVLAVSPDGATYLRADKPKPKPGAGTHPGEAVLGDARTGKDTARLGRLAPLQDGGRDGLAFAPDGKTVAVVYGSGRTVSVRDATTGKEVAALELPEDIYGGGTARFGKYGAEIGHARDGTVYVLLGSGGVVRWDPKADRELPGLEAGDDPVPGGVHLLPDGQTLLTPTTEGWVRVWDAGTGAERPVPGRYWGRVVVTLSPDGAVVAVADGSGRVDLRDAASGAFVRTVREKGGPAPRVVFSPDGGRLAVADTADPPEGPPEGDPGPPVTVYRAADGVAVGRVGRRTDEGGRAVPVGFTAGGLVLVQGTDPGLTAWDPATGAKVWGDPAGHPGGAASPDGRTVAVVEDHTLVFLDAETGKETRRAVLLPRDLIWWDEEAVCQVSWSADGRTAAVLPPGCHPIVLDVRTGRVRRRFGAESDADGKARRHWAGGWDGSAEKLTLGLSPDGSWAVVAGGGHAAVWQTATGARVAAVPAGAGSGSGPSAAVFAPDGRSVIAAYDGYAERIDLARAFVGAAAGPTVTLWDRAADGPEPWAAFALVGSAEGRAFLRDKLPPAPPDPGLPDRVKGWVADLGADDFATREAAGGELAAVAWRFGPALHEAFRKAGKPEARRRLVPLLSAAAAGPPPADRRVFRLVQAAEFAATPEARELLTAWAGGAAGAVLTDEAKAALARLDRK